MAESEMVERVARKLCCKGGCYIRRMNERAVTAELYDMPWSCLWESKIDDARAAIEAMREPTEAMDEAGQPMCGETGYDFPSIWKAAIDAALSPSTKD
jgi:hypothetical protein